MTGHKGDNRKSVMAGQKGHNPGKNLSIFRKCIEGLKGLT